MSDLLRRPLVVAVLAAALLGAGRARAALYGGIEIGAKGVKVTAVEIVPGQDGNQVKILLADTQNTNLTAGLATSKKFAPEALQATREAVAKFLLRVQKDHQVPPDNIHIVGSSGLFSPLAADADAIENNRKALAEAVRAVSGKPMTFIDARREAELSIAGVIPAGQANAAVLLDIGSGNTKGGYRNGEQGYVTFAVPYGSVTFAELIAKRTGKESLAEAASGARREVLTTALHKSVEDKPGLAGRDRVYLGGGAAWALATFARPGDRGSYVSLTVADIDRYQQMLLKTTGAYPTPDLSSIKDTAIREAAQKEIEQVKKTFTPEQLLAGAEILKALASEFNFDKEKKVRFCRHAYMGWILAYVVEKSGSR